MCLEGRGEGERGQKTWLKMLTGKLAQPPNNGRVLSAQHLQTPGPSNSSSRYIPNRHACIPGDTYKDVHSSTMCNSSKLKATQMPIGE